MFVGCVHGEHTIMQGVQFWQIQVVTRQMCLKCPEKLSQYMLDKSKYTGCTRYYAGCLFLARQVVTKQRCH